MNCQDVAHITIMCLLLTRMIVTQVQYVALRKQQKRPGSRFVNELG